MAFVVRPAPVGSFCQTGPSPRGFVLSNLPALGRFATGGFVLRFAVDSKLTGEFRSAVEVGFVLQSGFFVLGQRWIRLPDD
jgi:hypothetical protein